MKNILNKIVLLSISAVLVAGGFFIPSQTFAASSPKLQVTGAGAGSGTVTSSDGFINCTITAGVATGTCLHTYAANNPTVTLTASAGGSSFLTSLTGGGCSGTGTCTPTGINGNNTVAVIANFGLKTNQTISFTALDNKTYGDDDFSVSATATSGLSVTFSSQTSGVCTVAGSTLHIVSAGTCTVRASQAGNSSFNSAPSVDQSFTIAKATPILSLVDSSVGYDGLAHIADVSSSLADGIVSNVLLGGEAEQINAGTYSVTADFTPADLVNYVSLIGVVVGDFTINKAETTTSITCSDVVYNAGAQEPCSVSVIGAGDLSLEFTPVYENNTDAGTASASYSYDGDSNYEGSSDNVEFNIAQAEQTITFDALDGKTYGDDDFTVSATADSGLDVTFNATGNCSIDENSVHIEGAGSCTVTASQSGDGNFSSALDVEQVFDIAKAEQVITFDIDSHSFGDADFAISADSSSGLVVNLAVTSGECELTDGTLHITAAGDCTVAATQDGDDNFLPAEEVDRTFDISKAEQTITFDSLDGKTYGDDDFTVSATADSGLDVTFNATGNCSIDGGVVSITGAGSCTIIASQEGDEDFNSASDVEQTFDIAKAEQGALSVTGLPASATYNQADVVASAEGGDGEGEVTFSSEGDACTVDATTGGVEITSGSGTCTISTSKAEDSNFNPATSEGVEISIEKADQTINFTALSDKSLTDSSFTVSASADSSLVVEFSSSSTACSVSGSTVNLISAGNCTIVASQSGDDNYNAAVSVNQSFNIVLAPTDTTPLPFTFIDQTGVALNTLIESNTITVGGIDAATAISVTGGEYSINGGAYTSISGTVVLGNTVKVRQTSSASNNTSVNTTLNIGGVTDVFTTKTLTQNNNGGNGNGNGNGGGGGGGGGSAHAATPAVPAVPANRNEGCVPGGKFSSTTGAPCTGPATPATPAVPPGQVLGAGTYNFTLKLSNGSTGNEVVELQKLLNAKLNLTLTTDGKFGAKTKAALIKFQLANGLVGDGKVGPKTRAILNS